MVYFVQYFMFQIEYRLFHRTMVRLSSKQNVTKVSQL